MLLLHPKWNAEYKSIVLLLLENGPEGPIYALLRNVHPPELVGEWLLENFQGVDISKPFSIHLDEPPRKWAILRVDPYDPDTDPARLDT